jgi:anaerobic selenocysteine-containing dehydrogenase
MITRYQCGEWLNKAVGKSQASYIPEDCRKLIFDAKILDDLTESIGTETRFFDYSFLVAPVYKAIEGILWKIANELKLVHGDGQLGIFFDEDNVEKNIDLISENVLSKSKKAVVSHQLSELKTFLKRYRHLPAHYGSRFDTMESARLATNSSLHNISCLLKDLIELGLIKIEIENVPMAKAEEINLDDIPF